MDQKTRHLDPTDTAVAAILALDLDTHDNNLDPIVAALEPLVAAAPKLREWDVDDEWTIAEEAVAAASLIVCTVRNPAGDEHTTVLRAWDQIDRLRKLQCGHVSGLIRDRIGTFPGFQVWVGHRWSRTPTVRIFPAGVSADLSPPLFELTPDVTRREVETAIRGWKAGHDQGLREGAERIRRGMRDLLEVEAA